MIRTNVCIVYVINITHADMPHYETISDQVPHHYETIPETSSDLPHHYDIFNDSVIYSKEKTTDLMKYNWYHGNISEEQAEIAIADGNVNKFLVRHSDNKLILSHVAKGWRLHDVIHLSPEGYCLEGKEKMFKTVPAMIQHYKLFPIALDQVLGFAVDKTLSGKCCSHKTDALSYNIGNLTYYSYRGEGKNH